MSYYEFGAEVTPAYTTPYECLIAKIGKETLHQKADPIAKSVGISTNDMLNGNLSSLPAADQQSLADAVAKIWAQFGCDPKTLTQSVSEPAVSTESVVQPTGQITMDVIRTASGLVYRPYMTTKSQQTIFSLPAGSQQALLPGQQPLSPQAQQPSPTTTKIPPIALAAAGAAAILLLFR